MDRACVVSKLGENGIVGKQCSFRTVRSVQKVICHSSLGRCFGAGKKLSQTAPEPPTKFLYVQPGVPLKNIMDLEITHGLALPHGDALTVGAGGHFLSAGWDVGLSRKYGLGCSFVERGTLVRWDGSEPVTFSHDENRELLQTARGGYCDRRGVVTELWLRTIEQPEEVNASVLRYVLCEKSGCPELKPLHANGQTLAMNDSFSRFYNLPSAITTAVKTFWSNSDDCFVSHLYIVSLLSRKETEAVLKDAISVNFAKEIGENWLDRCKTLKDLRLITLSEEGLKQWEDGTIVKMRPWEFEKNGTQFYGESLSEREMKTSFMEQRSGWWSLDKVNRNAPLEVLKFFEKHCSHSDLHDLRHRVYSLFSFGGGTLWKDRRKVQMPMGKVIARFEVHADNEQDRCRIETLARRWMDEIHVRFQDEEAREWIEGGIGSRQLAMEFDEDSDDGVRKFFSLRPLPFSGDQYVSLSGMRRRSDIGGSALQMKQLRGSFLNDH